METQHREKRLHSFAIGILGAQQADQFLDVVGVIPLGQRQLGIQGITAPVVPVVVIRPRDFNGAKQRPIGQRARILQETALMPFAIDVDRARVARPALADGLGQGSEGDTHGKRRQVTSIS